MQKTKDQEEALNNMLHWATTPDWRYTLNGAAGTGKTTIVKEFINRINISKHRIAVSAPTHKAKKVIQDATDFKAQTIQKLLGLRPNVDLDNFNPHKPVFDQLGEPTIGRFKMLIIDEASMINTKAFELIEKMATNSKVKVLFMGDSYQLPPINEIISSVFKGSENISTLTTVVRQETTNPMVKPLKLMREDIKFNSFNALEYMKNEKTLEFNNTGFKTYASFDKVEKNSFGVELLNFYRSTEFAYNKNHIKFLSYTNDNVEHWSEGLRKALLKDEAKNLINVGEVLMGYKTLLHKKTNTNIIENSEDYIVTFVEPQTSEQGLKGFYVGLKNLEGFERAVFIVDTNNPETEDLYKARVANLIKDAEMDKRAWKFYYGFVEKHLSLKTYKYPAPLQWKTLISKDLYYGYGMTIHKSQGSTYDNVAINISNTYINKKVAERNRLIYVAASRARNMNLILI